ncbi:unnamed protein product [Adineta steineri]|uniref:Uncharacterized protein n=1 Tax=Adineta steineri TaxID=433720 RepID=A0A815LUC6_9BILA|nr:unnamed protein product [Adineta steineri]CAF3636900.1 unnamed protein product [Adineta steineri]
MLNKFIFIALICFTISLFTTGHVIRSGDKIDLNAKVNFDLKDINFGDNITYYSYHIHTYFLQKNENQVAEATALRSKFINQFKVDSCNDACGTWCPKICHWDLNMAPAGPHPIGSWGIYVPLEQVTETISFISMYHGNLTILVHPNSGQVKTDHLVNGFWIKSMLPLDGDELPDTEPIPPHGH